MNAALTIAPETLSPAQYLASLAGIHPSLAPIIDALAEEPCRAAVEAVLADALSHLPYVPDAGPDRAPESAPVPSLDRAKVIATELGWLSREIGWLRSAFESAVFRRLPGAGRREERDAARYRLALVARLFRLDRQNRSTSAVEEAVA